MFNFNFWHDLQNGFEDIILETTIYLLLIILNSQDLEPLTFRESDIIYPDDDNMTGCRSVSTYGLQVDMDTDKDHLDDTFNNRTKRSSYLNSIISDDKSPRLTRCPLMLVADYKFYREMGGGSTKATVSYLISLIDRVNKMYEDTIWSDSYDNEGFSGTKFVTGF